jgi:predicted lysophospholipase L1 biosynthesis ABC-type transport system permease subunit
VCSSDLEGEPLSVTEKKIRQTVSSKLPDLKVVTLSTIAVARYEAREATDRYNRILLSLIFAAALAFIAFQSYGEALRREKESALMSAVGFPGSTTFKLYLGKAILVALPSSLAGFAAGQFAAVILGAGFAKAKMAADAAMLPETLLLAFVCVFLSFIPAMVKSLRSEPFEILREE